MTVFEYLANSLAWSFLGLIGGAVLTELGWEFRSLISGRKRRDNT